MNVQRQESSCGINSTSGQNPGDNTWPLSLEDSLIFVLTVSGKGFPETLSKVPSCSPLYHYWELGLSAVVDGEVGMPSFLSAPQKCWPVNPGDRGFYISPEETELKQWPQGFSTGLANRFETSKVKLLNFSAPGEEVWAQTLDSATRQGQINFSWTKEQSEITMLIA